MPNKWEKFKYANTSKLNISNPNAGDAAIRLDLFRISKQQSCRINGVLIDDIATKYNNFSDDTDVLNFIDYELLGKLSFHDVEKQHEIDIAREHAINYLFKNFHQGGLLNPVTNALAGAFLDKDESPVGSILSNGSEKEINIITTKNGFKVQELIAIKKVNLISEDDPLNINIIELESGEALIYAQGTIDIDFTNDAKSPTLTVESNQMNVNHWELKKYIDHRGFGEVILDFLKNILGVNKVIILSPEKKESDAEEKESGTNEAKGISP